MPPTRREFLRDAALLSAASAAAAALPGCDSSAPDQTSSTATGGGGTTTPPTPPANSGTLPSLSFDFPTVLPLPFAHGVASGDPLADRVIIWTRITQESYDFSALAVSWFVGTGFTETADGPFVTGIVANGTQTTQADRDWTVKVDAIGLDPATTYYYQFFALGAFSLVGRTRTAPNAATTPGGDPINELRLAVLSCSSYWSSHWSGYSHIADRNDLDLVVHLGDYIYDFVDNDEEVRARTNAMGETKDQITDVDYRDWLNIDELRRRYALFRSDPNLARAHQQHPWAIVWDNHDIDPDFGNELDDSAVDSSGATTTLDECCQVFWEWTPSRPPSGVNGEPLLVNDGSYPTPLDVRQVWRRIDMGPLAEIICTDIEIYRQIKSTGESFPADFSAHLSSGDSLLGRSQYEYITQSMLATRDTKTWRILPHQTWLAPWNVPGLLSGMTVDGTPVETRWKDFPEERSQWFQFLRDNDIHNNISLSGDMHGNWASDLIEDNSLSTPYQSATTRPNTRPGSTAENINAGYARASTNNTAVLNNRSQSVGVDFAPTSMGRGGADELVANANPGSTLADQVAGARALEKASIDGNKNIQFKEWVDHGYGIVHLTADNALFEFWWQDKLTPNSPDVLGFQMVTWADDDALAVPSPKYRNQIDDVLLHGLTVTETTGSRTATPAPEGTLAAR